MAKYDHGGGCPCGLERVCNCKNSLKENVSYNHETLKSWRDVEYHGIALREWAKFLKLDLKYHDEIRKMLNTFCSGWDK